MSIESVNPVRSNSVVSMKNAQEKVIERPKEQLKDQTALLQEEKNEEKRITKETLEKTVEGLNKFLEPTHTNIKFQMHEKLQEYYVTIVDSKTNQVIKEIPPKKLLDIHAAMLESIGLIVDHRI